MGTESLFRNQSIVEFLQGKITRCNEASWLFVSVPEASTDWIYQRIADLLQPDILIAPDQQYKEMTFDECMEKALEKFLISDEFARYRLASGHFKAFQIDRFITPAAARLLTILRDPLDRLLSDFSRQNADTRANLTPNAFFEFVSKPANQNVYMQCFCPKGMWMPNECIAEIETRFDFIGIYEDIPMTLKMFYAIYGARYNAIAPESVDAGKITRRDLPPDLIRSASVLNSVDYEIFRYFHDRFISLKESFFSLVSSGKLYFDLMYR